MKSKILFIAFYEYGSIGIRTIQSFIQSKGYETYTVFFKEDIANQLFEPTDKEKRLLLDKINMFNPEIICITLRSPQFKAVSKVNKLIRERFPNIIVILGGSHATICPEECINHVDYVCIGEGEYPLLEFIEKRTTDIKNFWIRKNNKIIKNELRPLIQNLDELPIPDFSDNKCYIENGKLINEDPIIRLNKYQIMASRGCPYGCSYCSNSYLHRLFRGKGSYIRRRSVKHVIKELLYVKKVFKNLSVISFLDEIFDTDKIWLEEFIKEYKKINLPFRIECHPTTVKEENIKMLKQAGLRLVTMGIQSGSNRVRNEVFHRYTPDDQILNSAKIFNKYKLMANYDIIVDNPYETPEDMMEAINFLIKLPRPYNLVIYSLQNFPKTDLTERITADGLLTKIGTGVQGFTKLGARLTAKRSKESLYFICLVSLLSKNFIPKSLIKYLSKSVFFRKHDKLVVALADISNKIKIISYGGTFILRGEVSPGLFLKHLKNFKHIISGQR